MPRFFWRLTRSATLAASSSSNSFSWASETLSPASRAVFCACLTLFASMSSGVLGKDPACEVRMVVMDDSSGRSSRARAGDGRGHGTHRLLVCSANHIGRDEAAIDVISGNVRGRVTCAGGSVPDLCRAQGAFDRRCGDEQARPEEFAEVGGDACNRGYDAHCPDEAVLRDGRCADARQALSAFVDGEHPALFRPYAVEDSSGGSAVGEWQLSALAQLNMEFVGHGLADQ